MTDNDCFGQYSNMIFTFEFWNCSHLECKFKYQIYLVFIIRNKYFQKNGVQKFQNNCYR